ncbi:hypothetical protein MtrunA17_Chr3g0112941 [Medicago truncatula]|uniref:Uncharacterized protein n=1 Tax=Medicago truncatula TaxID=3880 RepID=A0A396IRM8_MEDTR|nr:hypothetical protein MtrunA17_Chr3g0112941 [Medicago truncatula]
MTSYKLSNNSVPKPTKGIFHHHSTNNVHTIYPLNASHSLLLYLLKHQRACMYSQTLLFYF